MTDFWVFGYGSLMWNPGFAFEERRTALAYGYRRALCVRSWVHRGSQDKPGLVLGLDRGGSAKGVAFRIKPEQMDDVVSYLRARELVTMVYKERTIDIRLDGGQRTKALTYVIDRNHVQYAPDIDIEHAAVTVAQATGQSGANHDYVAQTLAHMRDLGIRDHWLEQVHQRTEQIRQEIQAP
jgi:cation transport protein ChaC